MMKKIRSIEPITTPSDTSSQDNARQQTTPQGKATQDKTPQDNTSQDKATHENTRHDKTPQEEDHTRQEGSTSISSQHIQTEEMLCGMASMTLQTEEMVGTDDVGFQTR